MINAVVARLDNKDCLALADPADRAVARHEPVGPLHGLPGPSRILKPPSVFPSRSGYPIFRNEMPTEDPSSSKSFDPPALLPSGRPTCRNSVGLATPTTAYTERRGIPTIDEKRGWLKPWRCRRGPGRGPAAARGRQRFRRLVAQPRELQQRRWFSPERRASCRSRRRCCRFSGSA